MFKERLIKILTKMFYVMFALAVSVALWFYVEISENKVQTSEVSGIGVVFKNEEVLRDKGLLLSSILTENLSITFQGSRTDLSNLTVQGALSVEVDLGNVPSAGTHLLAYRIVWPQSVNSSDVSILGQTASRIAIEIDRILDRQIPVKVNYTGGTASDDLMADPVEYDPQTITVWGPEKIVSQIHYVFVPILRENLSTTITDEFEFILLNEHEDEIDEVLRESIELSQETIRVTIPIRQIKEVPLRVNLVHGAGSSDVNTTVDIQPKTIKISGDPVAIREIDHIMLGTIDMLSFGLTDTFQFPVIILQEHINNVSNEPVATVLVEVLGVETTIRVTSNLHTINTPPGYRSEILTQSLDVRLRGPAEVLALITSMNVRVVADLTDIGTGTTSVIARIYIDGIDAEIGAYGEHRITVTITAE